MERAPWRTLRRSWRTLAVSALPKAGRQRAALATLALLLGVVLFHGSLLTAPSSPSGACTGLTWESQRGPECVDLRAPFTAHGLVKKAGPVSLRWWSDAHAEWRTAQFGRWLRKTMADSRNGTLAVGRPPPVVRCDTYVNHRYRVLYVRCPKVASTAILQHFTECIGTGPNQAAWCLTKLDSGMHEEEARAVWAGYLVFGFTRSPFARALSTYKFLAHQVVASEACGAMLGWDSFCEDPTVMGRACRRNMECCIHGAAFMFHHTEPQLPCLTTPDGGWAVDFLGRVEHMEGDLEALLVEINRRRSDGLPPLAFAALEARRNSNDGCAEVPFRTSFRRPDGSVAEYDVQVAPEQYCDREQYFSGEHAHCLAGLARYYAPDLALFRGEAVAQDALAA